MSSPLPIILANEAADDFAGILQYTLETCGEAQVADYKAILDKSLLTVRQYPRSGSDLPELGNGVYTLSAGEHIIIYEPRPDAIYVYRIMHNRMDIAQNL